MTDQDDVPMWLRDLNARHAAASSFTGPALRERFGEPIDVTLEPGQLWRAGWGNVAVLVLVLRLDEGKVWAAPVTIDPPAEEESSVVLVPDLTGFPTPVTVWIGLARSFPHRVLDTLVAVWSSDVVVTLANPATLEPEARLPHGIRRGRPIDSTFDDRSAVRADLEDDIDQLGQMPGLPPESPGSSPTNLASMLRDIDLAALCAALDLSQPAVMKILRGTTTLTPAQAAVIARMTDVPKEQLLSAVRGMPQDLVQTAEHPRWRQVWIERAQQLGTDENQVRLDVCRRVVALAARQTGSSRPDWDARLRRVLQGDEGTP